MSAQPAMLLPVPEPECEPESCLQSSDWAQGGRYDGTPKAGERQLAVVLAMGLSTLLLAALLAIHGQAGPSGDKPAALTTFSITEAHPASPPKPAPAPARKTQPLPPIEPPPLSIEKGPAASVTLRVLTSAAWLVLEPRKIGAATGPTATTTHTASASGSSASVSEAAPAPVGAPHGQSETDRYAQSVFEKIRREQRYEAVLRRDSLAGTVVLAFTIDRRGKLRGQRVAVPSAHPAIDRLALRHLGDAAPFPRPPRGEARSFQIPLTYRQRE